MGPTTQGLASGAGATLHLRSYRWHQCRRKPTASCGPQEHGQRGRGRFPVSSCPVDRVAADPGL
ncbi:hypothetical protein KIL84_007937 [Mauremys mutica]|uniref:Uncharacterized protein n=1 Tax=Mauremys mutica TaxID=74926 RepID=A0A9D4AW39_9SAUR|nr:hypothetical protein KIL84_007937 [Mauremys mutica]